METSKTALTEELRRRRQFKEDEFEVLSRLPGLLGRIPTKRARVAAVNWALDYLSANPTPYEERNK